MSTTAPSSGRTYPSWESGTPRVQNTRATAERRLHRRDPLEEIGRAMEGVTRAAEMVALAWAVVLMAVTAFWWYFG